LTPGSRCPPRVAGPSPWRRSSDCHSGLSCFDLLPASPFPRPAFCVLYCRAGTVAPFGGAQHDSSTSVLAFGLVKAPPRHVTTCVGRIFERRSPVPVSSARDTLSTVLPIFPFQSALISCSSSTAVSTPGALYPSSFFLLTGGCLSAGARSGPGPMFDLVATPNFNAVAGATLAMPMAVMSSLVADVSQHRLCRMFPMRQLPRPRNGVSLVHSSRVRPSGWRQSRACPRQFPAHSRRRSLRLAMYRGLPLLKFLGWAVGAGRAGPSRGLAIVVIAVTSVSPVS